MSGNLWFGSWRLAKLSSSEGRARFCQRKTAGMSATRAPLGITCCRPTYSLGGSMWTGLWLVALVSLARQVACGWVLW